MTPRLIIPCWPASLGRFNEDIGVAVSMDVVIRSLVFISIAQRGGMETLNNKLRLAGNAISKPREANTRPKRERTGQQHDTLSLQATFISGTTSAGCAGCADQETEHCPGPDLCGKKILYVGGLKKMVPHYRQLVENFGGRFMHHDGGVEVSRNQLLKSGNSILASIGKTITPIFKPMGVSAENWPATIGIFTGIFAKEAVVGTLDSFYGKMDAAASDEIESEEPYSLWASASEALATIPEGLMGIVGRLSDSPGAVTGRYQQP